MKAIGVILLIIGGIGLLIGVSKDTTVESSTSFGRIHNIGLMSDKQTTLIVSGCIAIVGAILTGFGAVVEANANKSGPTIESEIERQREASRAALQQLEASRLQRLRDQAALTAGINRERRRERWIRRRAKIARFPGRVDSALRNWVGPENVLLYRFLQVLIYLILPHALVGIVAAICV